VAAPAGFGVVLLLQLPHALSSGAIPGSPAFGTGCSPPLFRADEVRVLQSDDMNGRIIPLGDAKRNAPASAIMGRCRASS